MRQNSEARRSGLTTTLPDLYPPSPNPASPHHSPSAVLFQERSCGRWFPPAETCEDSARSGRAGDRRSCTHTNTQQSVGHSGAHGGEAHTQRQDTDLLMNCSKPTRRCSMKESSKRPSSWRNGSCLFRALPGRDGTTICRVAGIKDQIYYYYFFFFFKDDPKNQA